MIFLSEQFIYDEAIAKIKEMLEIIKNDYYTKEIKKDAIRDILYSLPIDVVSTIYSIVFIGRNFDKKVNNYVSYDISNPSVLCAIADVDDVREVDREQIIESIFVICDWKIEKLFQKYNEALSIQDKYTIVGILDVDNNNNIYINAEEKSKVLHCGEKLIIIDDFDISTRLEKDGSGWYLVDTIYNSTNKIKGLKAMLKVGRGTSRNID